MSVNYVVFLIDDVFEMEGLHILMKQTRKKIK